METPKRYELKACPGYLKLEVTGRRTSGETQTYLSALRAEAEHRRLFKVLISLRECTPLFRVEEYDLKQLLEVAKQNDAAIAVTADTEEVRLSQQLVEVLARQHRVNLRAFESESEALQWLARTAASERGNEPCR